MDPAPADEGWQLVAVDLGVDNGAVDRRVHEVLYDQDLRREYPWSFNSEEHGGFYQDERKTQVKSWVDQV